MIMSGFDKKTRKAIKKLKREILVRERYFIYAYNEVYGGELKREDLHGDDYEELTSLCELYHRLRSNKPIIK